jgi:plasmid stability protein
MRRGPVELTIPPLPPELAERLAIEAKARGLSVEALALEIIREALRRADSAVSQGSNRRGPLA